MSSNWLFALLGSVLLALAGCGKKESSGGGEVEIDDPNGFSLKIADPQVGSPMRGSLFMDLKQSQSVTGKVNDIKNDTIKEDMVYRETVLERPRGAKRPLRSSIFIEKWETSQKTFSDKGVRDRLIGKEIQAQKVGGEYQFTNPNGSPIDPSVKIYLNQMFTKLYESFNMGDFLPNKPVKKSDTWSIPISKMAKAASQSGMMRMNEAMSKGTGKLLRVTQLDGRKYARIEMKAEMVPVEIAGMPMKPGAKMDVSYLVDACIDGTRHDVKVEAKIEARMGFDVPGENMSIKIEINGDIKVTEVEEGSGSSPKSASSTGPTGRSDAPIEPIAEAPDYGETAPQPAKSLDHGRSPSAPAPRELPKPSEPFDEKPSKNEPIKPEPRPVGVPKA